MQTVRSKFSPIKLPFLLYLAAYTKLHANPNPLKDNCNWLGGQAVAEKINATNFASAGFTNITTSDAIVHGQVKQSSNFAFVRVYYSGHEVPFYQPLLALEMFERVINGKDVATGEAVIGANYTTVGPSVSTFREGNATVQFEVVPTSATYNVTTGAPNPYASTNETVSSSSTDSGSSSRKSKRSLGGKQKNKRSLQKRSSALLRQNKRWL